MEESVESLERGLVRLNSLTQAEALKELLKCCGSTRWAKRMFDKLPFHDFQQMLTESDRIWSSLEREDWLEAFRSHPKIGEKKAAQPQQPAAQNWSQEEQSGTREAGRELLDQLAELNRDYEKKFGYIFIICATGRTSEEMLASLRERLHNDADTELRIAAEEQRRITHLRLRKLLKESESPRVWSLGVKKQKAFD